MGLTLLLCHPIVATEVDDVLVELEETNLAVSHDRLGLEGCPARQNLFVEIGDVPALAMEVCEVGDEGIVLGRAVNVALIVGL